MRVHGDYLHTRELLAYHGAEFTGFKVGEERIQQKDFARSFVKTLERFGAARSFYQAPTGLTKGFPQLEAEPAVRAHQQHTNGAAFVHAKSRGWAGAHRL